MFTFPKSSVSLGELAICEDFLDSNREYAIGLFSNVKKIHQRHAMGCPETREGRMCLICELCSADGLLGATKKAFASLNDAENRLQEVRASLGSSAPSRATPSRETLFKSNLAKTIFLCIVTVGDTLRSHHVTWQARLQSELATSPLHDQSPQDINTDPCDFDKDRNGEVPPPTYSGSGIDGPKLAVVPPGLAPEHTSSSMLVVFRQCPNDCPCEASGTSVASKTSLGGACGSQFPSPPLGSKEMHKSKGTAKLGAASRGSENHATWSTTTAPERRSKGPSDTSDALSKTRTNAQTQMANTYHDANNLVAQRPQHVMPGEERVPLDSRSKTALLIHEGELSSSPELIVDSRLFHLRAQIVRSDEMHRALMEWCRTWAADLRLDPQERHGTGPKTSLTHESTMRVTRGYPLASARGLKSVGPEESLCMMGQEAATNGQSDGNDEAMAQGQRLNSEQEELKRRWILAREKRCKDKTRRPARI